MGSPNHGWRHFHWMIAFITVVAWCGYSEFVGVIIVALVLIGWYIYELFTE